MLAPSPAIDVTAALRQVGVIPVVTFPDPAAAPVVAGILGECGLTWLEVTFRAPRAAEAIAAIRLAHPSLVVGAGTILTLDQADSATEAGAAFIVTPGSSARVIDRALELGVDVIPGVATPSEITANLERGLRLLKLFPAELCGGVRFLETVRGPFPDIRFVPTGGVNPTLLPDYLRQPNVAAVGGTWIAPRAAVERADLVAIRAAASEASRVVAELRRSDA